jgi:hypothetical protein
MLYMTLIFGMRDLLVHAIRLLKVQSKFMPNENDRIQKEAENSKQIQLKLDNPEEE